MRSFRLFVLAGLLTGSFFSSMPCIAQESIPSPPDDDGPTIHDRTFTENGVDYVLSTKTYILAPFYIGISRQILRYCYTGVATVQIMPWNASAAQYAAADKQLAEVKWQCVQHEVIEARQQNDLPDDAVLTRK